MTMLDILPSAIVVGCGLWAMFAALLAALDALRLTVPRRRGQATPPRILGGWFALPELQAPVSAKKPATLPSGPPAIDVAAPLPASTPAIPLVPMPAPVLTSADSTPPQWSPREMARLQQMRA